MSGCPGFWAGHAYKRLGTENCQSTVREQGRSTFGGPAFRLWILETNTGAERLYRRFGFRLTGKREVHPGGVDEVEMAKV